MQKKNLLFNVNRKMTETINYKILAISWSYFILSVVKYTQIASF